MRKTLTTFGFYSSEAPRYVNTVKEFQSEGYEILECHTDAKGFFGKCFDLRKKYKKQLTVNSQLLTVYVPFPGHHLMPLAWWLTRFPRKKLIFDVFISVSDTLVSDRKKYSWRNPIAWFLYLVDFFSMHLADECLIDTEAHKEFLSKRFYLNPKRIRVMYVGTREDLFYAGPKENDLKAGAFNVLFIGSYIPLQGIEFILDAAKILESDASIHFTLLGNGQTYKEMRQKADDLHLQNVTFIDFQPIETLPHYLRSCDVSLGIFGVSDKALRVIPHKVYDAIGCGVPVITSNNRAIEEKFTNGKEVHLCKPGSGEAIAGMILNVKRKSE